MTNFIQKLFIHSAIYSIGNASLQLANFLLVPLYAKYLTPEEFGIQALFVILIALLTFTIDLGVRSAINRVYYDYQTDEEKKRFTGTTFIFTNLFGLLIVTLLYPFERQATQILTNDLNYTNIYHYILFDIFFLMTFRLYLAFLRIKNRPVLFVILSIGKLLLVLMLIIYFVAYQKEGLLGIFKGNYLSSLILYLVLFPFLLKDIKIAFDFGMIKALIAFGLPFIPVNIFSFFLTSSDRYILKEFCDLREVGLYAMGYRIGMVINVFVVQPFVLAWPQQIVPISQREDSREVFKQIITYFVGIAGFVVMLLIIYLDDIYRIFLSPAYYDSKKIVPVIAISYLFNGLYYLFLVGIFLEKKTKYPPLIVSFAAFFNLIINITYFIPRWGMMGAAIATFLSYLIIPVMTIIISNQFYKLEIECLRIIKLIMAYSLVVIFAQNIESVMVTLFWASIVVKLTIVVFITPLILIIMNFFNNEEKKQLISLLKKMTARTT